MNLNIRKIIGAKSTDEDKRRKEYILNVILSVTIIILSLCDLIILRNSILKAGDYNGIDFLSFTLIISIYCVLFILSKRGHVKTSSYILILTYWAGALNCGYQWGASLPITLIAFIFIILISSILIGSNFGIIITIITIISFILLGIHEYKNPEILSWRSDTINNTDLIVYSFFLICIALLAKLSNNEIEKSLERARKSEIELKKEKDLLEIKVEQRTKELKESQLTRMVEIEKFAEFGRLSQGLFHDLLSPLTSMVLHMEKIKGIPASEIHSSHDSLEKIVLASKKMNRNIERMRQSMKNSMPAQICQMDEEISKCIDLLSFKIKENNIKIQVENNFICRWFGDPVKLQQVFSNLISNAIDACALNFDKQGKIRMTIDRQGEKCAISFIDNGVGMDKEILNKIFDPFFTTKSPEQGTGIGLTTVKKIIEEIGGTITVTSSKNIGSQFIISLPIEN